MTEENKQSLEKAKLKDKEEGLLWFDSDNSSKFSEQYRLLLPYKKKSIL